MTKRDQILYFDSKKRYLEQLKEKPQSKTIEKKILMFFPGKKSMVCEKEQDIYYNKDVGYVSIAANFYPKSCYKFAQINNLFLSKAISEYCDFISLEELVSRYKSQKGLLKNQLIIITDDKFISVFYKNPGKHWKEFVETDDYNLLIALHTIAIDTTVFRINSGLTTLEIQESIYFCTLHILLLEQLIPPIIKEKQFLIEMRQRLFLCIKYAIKHEKLFFDIKDFFKHCMQYFINNSKELALTLENLHAIDFRFQRYLFESQAKV